MTLHGRIRPTCRFASSVALRRMEVGPARPLLPLPPRPASRSSMAFRDWLGLPLVLAWPPLPGRRPSSSITASSSAPGDGIPPGETSSVARRGRTATSGRNGNSKDCLRVGTPTLPPTVAGWDSTLDVRRLIEVAPAAAVLPVGGASKDARRSRDTDAGGPVRSDRPACNVRLDNSVTSSDMPALTKRVRNSDSEGNDAVRSSLEEDPGNAPFTVCCCC